MGAEERRRGRRTVRVTLIGAALAVVLGLAGIAVIDVLTDADVHPVTYGGAAMLFLTVGLGIAPLIALAQDDGEEDREHRPDGGPPFP